MGKVLTPVHKLITLCVHCLVHRQTISRRSHELIHVQAQGLLHGGDQHHSGALMFTASVGPHESSFPKHYSNSYQASCGFSLYQAPDTEARYRYAQQFFI